MYVDEGGARKVRRISYDFSIRFKFLSAQPKFLSERHQELFAWLFIWFLLMHNKRKPIMGLRVTLIVYS